MKKLLLLLMIVLMVSPANALNYTENIDEGISIEPDTNKSIGNFTLTETESVQVTGIISTGVPFNVTFDSNQFTLNNESKTINAIAYIPKGFAPNVYSGNINVMSNESNLIIPFSVTVPEKRNFLIYPISIDYDIYNGIESNIGNITINNTGNIDDLFEVEVSDSLYFIECKSRIDSFRGMSNELVLVSDTPKNIAFGTYNGNITLKDKSGNRTTINITLDINDRIRPEIEYTTFNDVEATQTVQFLIKTTDNLEISSVTSEIFIGSKKVIGNQTVDYLEFFENITFEYDDNTKMYFKDYYNTDRIGTYYVNIYSKDTSGNIQASTDNFTVVPLDAMEYSETITLTKSKEPHGVFLTVDVDMPFEVEILNLSYNGNWKAEIGNSNLIKTTHATGDLLRFEAKGEYEIRIIDSDGNNTIEKEVDGIIRIHPIDQHVELKDIYFTGTMIYYEIGEPFDEYVNGNRVTGEIIDTGDLDSSNYKVCTYYPITTPREEISYCETADQYYTIKNSTEKQISELEDKIKHKDNVIFFSGISLIGLFIASIFMFRIYPRLYFTVR